MRVLSLSIRIKRNNKVEKNVNFLKMGRKEGKDNF